MSRDVFLSIFAFTGELVSVRYFKGNDVSVAITKGSALLQASRNELDLFSSESVHIRAQRK